MEKQIKPSEVGTLLTGVLKPIKTIIEEAHQKEVELMEWAGDYRDNTLTYFYKFRGSMDRFKDGPKLFDNDSSTFSEMMLDGLKKQLPVKKVVAFILLFDMRTFEISRVRLYYLNNNDLKSVYDSKVKKTTN